MGPTGELRPAGSRTAPVGRRWGSEAIGSAALGEPGCCGLQAPTARMASAARTRVPERESVMGKYSSTAIRPAPHRGWSGYTSSRGMRLGSLLGGGPAVGLSLDDPKIRPLATTSSVD